MHYINVENELNKNAGIMRTGRDLFIGTAAYHLGKHVKENEDREEFINNIKSQLQQQKYAALERRVLEKQAFINKEAANFIGKAIGKGLGNLWNKGKSLFKSNASSKNTALGVFNSNFKRTPINAFTGEIKGSFTPQIRSSMITSTPNLGLNVQKAQGILNPNTKAIDKTKSKVKNIIDNAVKKSQNVVSPAPNNKTIGNVTVTNPAINFGRGTKAYKYKPLEELSEEGVKRLTPATQYQGSLQNIVEGNAIGKALTKQDAELLKRSKNKVKVPTDVWVSNSAKSKGISKKTVEAPDLGNKPKTTNFTNEPVEFKSYAPIVEKDITGAFKVKNNPKIDLSVSGEPIPNGKGTYKFPEKVDKVDKAVEQADTTQSKWKQLKNFFKKEPKTEAQVFAEKRFSKPDYIPENTTWSDAYNSIKGTIKNNPKTSLALGGAATLYGANKLLSNDTNNYYYGGNIPMYNQYDMNNMNKTAAYGKNLFSDIGTFLKRNKGYAGRTGGAFGDWIQEVNPYAKGNINNFGKWITPKSSQTAFMGHTRQALGDAIANNPNAVRAAVTGALATPTAVGLYNMAKTSSINDDLELEYNAAMNEAVFAENMYNEAVEKMASIEDYVEKDAASMPHLGRSTRNLTARAGNAAGNVLRSIARAGGKLSDSGYHLGIPAFGKKKGVLNATKRVSGKQIEALADLARRNPRVATALAAGAVGGGTYAAAR